jgi:hypothetical protein
VLIPPGLPSVGYFCNKISFYHLDTEEYFVFLFLSVFFGIEQMHSLQKICVVLSCDKLSLMNEMIYHSFHSAFGGRKLKKMLLSVLDKITITLGGGFPPFKLTHSVSVRAATVEKD